MYGQYERYELPSRFWEPQPDEEDEARMEAEYEARMEAEYDGNGIWEDEPLPFC